MKINIRSIVYTLANRAVVVFKNAQRHTLLKSFKSCGRDVTLYMPVCISQPGNVEVGSNVGISPLVHIWGGGGVKIGNGVMIGSHTAITSLTHSHDAELMHETLIRKPVVIEDNVWIGSHCVIMPGITIRQGAVVGAGSVVTKDVEPNAIVIGSPARLLKYRQIESALNPGGTIA